jgi:hypothetical protein
MTSPILALRAAILARLSGDPDLLSLMGGTLRLHDEAPRAATPVYAVFGEVTAVDWSTDLDRGHEQDLAIVVWAQPGSARSGLIAAERLAVLLDGADLAPAGHRLVNLRVTAISSARDERSHLARVSVRLRAVTEVTAASAVAPPP